MAIEVWIAALAAGFAGGVHCVGMCGGIAGIVGNGSRRTIPIAAADPSSPPVGRILAFNAGRIASYAVAGGVAGGLGSVVSLAAPIEVARTSMFIGVQLMLIVLGLYVAGWSTFLPRLEAAGATVWNALAPVRRRVFAADSPIKTIAAGAVWGWVPCGLVYAMLPVALGAGGALNGMLILAAFGVGTLPWMLAAGALGVRFERLRDRAWIRRTAGGLLIVLAVWSLLQLAHGH